MSFASLGLMPAHVDLTLGGAVASVIDTSEAPASAAGDAESGAPHVRGGRGSLNFGGGGAIASPASPDSSDEHHASHAPVYTPPPASAAAAADSAPPAAAEPASLPAPAEAAQPAAAAVSLTVAPEATVVAAAVPAVNDASSTAAIAPSHRSTPSSGRAGHRSSSSTSTPADGSRRTSSAQQSSTGAAAVSARGSIGSGTGGSSSGGAPPPLLTSDITPTATPKRAVGFADDSEADDGERKAVTFEAASPSQSQGSASPEALIASEEDARVQRSKFKREKTKLKVVSENASNHYGWMALAIFQMIVRCVDTITDWMLIVDFFTRDGGARGPQHYGAATGLLVIHILIGATQIEFDWLNLGRNQYWWADLFQARSIVEFVFYYRDWRRHQMKPWANRDFRSAVCFESFLGTAPALIVQVWVMLIDPDYVSWIQTLSLIVTALSMCVDLFHFFKYISVSWETYAWMMGKGMFNTAARTLLVAFLVDSLKVYVWLWVLLSYLLSCFVYYLAVRRAKKEKRDDPLLFRWCHVAYGGLVACHMTFISIPFAPTHAIVDWWWGYMASEIKINLENAAMLAAVLVTIDHPHDVVYFAGVFFAACIFIANLTAIIFMHRSVSKQLAQRNLYSSTLIVKLFAYLCTHLKVKLAAKKAAKEGMDEADEDEHYETHDAEVHTEA